LRDPKLYIKDIIDAMETLEKFIEGMDFEEFRGDDKTTSAAIRKFEIIGEAAKQMPDEIKQKHPDVPWKEMAGMRDRLIHLYFGVDYNLVWTTIKNRIPQVKPLIRKIIS
jgi:uncharacterized protein with HEPN domain